MSVRLPIIAERLFPLLCAEAEGVTCNKSSDEDNAGWDFVVHFPVDPSDPRPRDEQRGHDTAFVQVKSTATAPFSVQLKLSNALRMAQERTPYFLVLIVGADEARRVLARHFWTDEIESTLRRVRQAEAAGHRKQLHRRRLTLSLLDKDDHTDDLLSWMSSTIRSVRGDYHAAKAAILNSVGYEPGSMKLLVSLTASPDEVMDWELGLRPLPRVANLKVTNTRFGVEIPDPTFTANGAFLKVQPVGQDCFIQLRTRATTVSLMGKLYYSTVAQVAPSERAWRADLGCMTLTWRSNALSGHFAVDFTERLQLARLAQHVAIATWAGEEDIEAILFLNRTRVDLGTLELSDRADADEWIELASWLSTLKAIAEAQPGCEPSISVGDVLGAGIWLKRFHELFASPAVRIEHPAHEADDPTHAIIYLLRCNVGNWSFFALVRREVAVDTIHAQTRVLYLKPAELLEGFVCEGDWKKNIEHVQASYARHVHRMGDPTYFWDFGDMEDWLSRLEG